MGWNGVEFLFEKSVFGVLHPTVGWSMGWSFRDNFLMWGGVGWSILAENFHSAPLTVGWSKIGAPPHDGVEWGGESTP